MFNILKTATLSAMIGLGGMAALPANALADRIYLNLGNGGPDLGVHVRDGYRDDNWERNDRRDRRDRDRWDRGFERRGCTPDRALDKADRMGLDRVRVVDVNRRSITVAGRKWHNRVHVTFARAPNCPVIG